MTNISCNANGTCCVPAHSYLPGLVDELYFNLRCWLKSLGKPQDKAPGRQISYPLSPELRFMSRRQLRDIGMETFYFDGVAATSLRKLADQNRLRL